MNVDTSSGLEEMNASVIGMKILDNVDIQMVRDVLIGHHWDAILIAAGIIKRIL